MTDPDRQQRIRNHWVEVFQDIRRAAENCGRAPESIRVIGVTKYVDSEIAGELVRAGCHELGENRPQSLWQKADALGNHPELCWHLIGHLQRNKVRRVLRYRPLIHSIDSQRLLDAVADEAVRQGQTVTVLLETNISGDRSKTGLDPEALKQMIDQIPSRGVDVVGLMAMAGLGSSPALARQQFAAVRQLRDQLRHQSGRSLPELSMGMSGDFEEAIAEGATMVRIGTRLFRSVIDSGD
jgi:pyridoxal phosphate enzyme (YggS family)